MESHSRRTSFENKPPRKISILIADDFEAWRSEVRNLLGERADWEVICEVADGLPAVQRASQLHPDVVLLDIAMPGLNGIEAANEIRQVCPSAKIVFLTQQTDQAVMDVALATGARGYVLKSNAASHLLSTI